MKNIFFPAAAISLLVAFPALAAEQRVSIDVRDMTCPTCVYTVAASMRSVNSVNVLGFKKSARDGEGVFIVTYDDQAANPQMIVKAVVENGYPAALLPGGGS